MELKQWAREYLLRNCKIKQWSIVSIGDDNAIVNNGKNDTLYEFKENMKEGIRNYKNQRIIITINTKENVKAAQGMFDSIDNNTRILFANTQTDSFWILNPHFLRNYSSPEQFKKNPASLVGETPYM